MTLHISCFLRFYGFNETEKSALTFSLGKFESTGFIQQLFLDQGEVWKMEIKSGKMVKSPDFLFQSYN